jgi:hypothetical protein
MKRKPILLKKLARESRGKFREVIGLIGTHAGTGVTHTGLMLAFYLGEELGRKTAFLECNDHKDMNLIQKAYEWSNEEETSFCFRNITCFKNVLPSRVADILGENYEFVVIDFGTDLKGNREEFLRCSTKAVVGGHSEWDVLKLLWFIKGCETIRGGETWTYLIPQAGEKLVTRLKKETRCRICAVPYVEDPTHSNRSTKQLFKEMLRLA